ncbi:hypothetical protein [Sphingomonas sp.]|uniref:hypothetical protein n=1 Tax=Sphingomonas sp. TaxID=28214 RepID=UPI001B0583AD|nr:hypothetical protein [Sphingomonas sp.]MBO9715195.1 hypothetical protein [Sphingomonas sp.]
MAMMLAIALPALFLSAPVPRQIEVPRIGAPATIPYTSLGGLFREFVALPDGSAVYLRDRRNHWYLARFEARCEALSRAPIMGFERSREMRIAAGTTISFPREAGPNKCRIAQLTYSDSPPAGLRRDRWSSGGSASQSVSFPVGDRGDRPSPRGVTLR